MAPSLRQSRRIGTSRSSFVLGTGQVIRGWDEGVATLVVGDKVRLTIPSELAYGDAGYPGLIPAGKQRCDICRSSLLAKSGEQPAD